MKEYLCLGPVPYEEDCVQVDPEKDYLKEMQEECEKYKEMLVKRFPGAESVGCRFAVKWFEHDFGQYCEVVIWYDDKDEESSWFAYEVEGNTPGRWSDDEIILLSHPQVIEKCFVEDDLDF